MRLGLTFLLCACFFASNASTKEAVNFPREVVEIFAAFCAGNAGRPDKTEALAVTGGLKELDKNTLKALGPQDPPISSQGWVVLNEPELKVLVATSITKVNSKKVSTCSVAGDSVFGDDVLKELSALGDLGDVKSDLDTFGGRIIYWEVAVLGELSRLMLAFPTRRNTPGVTIGLVTEID